MLKKRRFFILTLCLLTSLFFLLGCSPGEVKLEDETLRVHFIDVGQGDSILIQTPYNKESILIDGGSRQAAQQVIEYLQKQGVKKINLLIATHPHEDHIGGLVEVLRAFPIDKIIDSGKKHNSKTYKRYLEIIAEKNIPVELAKDQQLKWEENIEFSVLGPVRKDYGETNDYSVVTKLIYGGIAFLFTGDMEKNGERDILDKDLEASILKVGHHGSRSSTSAHFLRKVKPEVAIISLGKDNDYGHPHEITLKKLEKSKVKVYRTDLNGTIRIITDGKGYSVEVEK